MVEMEIEEVLSYASLCGIWIDNPQALTIEKLTLLLNKSPWIRFISYCLINECSLLLGNKLKELQISSPSFRLVAIGNNKWYTKLSIETQNSILKMKDQADIFAHCSFPVEDAKKVLFLFCDHILFYSSSKRRIVLMKTDTMHRKYEGKI